MKMRRHGATAGRPSTPSLSLAGARTRAAREHAITDVPRSTNGGVALWRAGRTESTDVLAQLTDGH